MVVQSKHSVVVAKINVKENVLVDEILRNLTNDTLVLSPVRMVEGSVRLEDKPVRERERERELTEVTWQVIRIKGAANQSWSNTSPSEHSKVRLKPTGGAGVRSRLSDGVRCVVGGL